MKILLFILFICIDTFAQNNFSEKGKDSIFLYFDQTSEIKDLKLSSYSGIFTKMYYFTYPDGQQIDFEAYIKGRFSKENFFKRKSYLKKNAKRIITAEDFKNLGRDKIIELFSKKKPKIFIIDKSDYKRNKIKLSRLYLRSYILDLE